jgi:hypothetical protein
MRYYDNPKDERRDRWNRKNEYKHKKKVKNFSKVPRPDLTDDDPFTPEEEEVLDEVIENVYSNEVIEQLEPDEE